MSWQEWCKVLAHRDWSNARSASAMRDAKRLMQIQVRHVGAEFARLG